MMMIIIVYYCLIFGTMILQNTASRTGTGAAQQHIVTAAAGQLHSLLAADRLTAGRRSVCASILRQIAALR